MRISDWSSDVCSSDLEPVEPHAQKVKAAQQLDAARTRFAQGCLRLAEFEERESGAATGEPVLDEANGAAGAWQHLGIDPFDFRHDQDRKSTRLNSSH